MIPQTDAITRAGDKLQGNFTKREWSKNIKKLEKSRKNVLKLLALRFAITTSTIDSSGLTNHV